MTYAQGFEDALELCIEEVEKAKDKRHAIAKLRDNLAQVKNNKFDRLRNMLTRLPGEVTHDTVTFPVSKKAYEWCRKEAKVTGKTVDEIAEEIILQKLEEVKASN